MWGMPTNDIDLLRLELAYIMLKSSKTYSAG